MGVLGLVFWISLVLVAYTYIVYPGIVFLLVKVKPRRKKAEPAPLPTVTVVISAFNEERVLPAKLQNIQRFDYPQEKLSLLFGSDGSTDQTDTILAGASIRGLSVIPFPQRRGKPSVLNDLVSLASGEIVVFSDANTMFRPDTVSTLVRHFADPTVGAVSGELRIDEHPDTVTGIGETSYWNYENILKQMESDVDSVVGATGGVYAIRRLLYENLPTTKAVTDDLLIPLNIIKRGYRIDYDREALAFERGEGSIKEEFRRKVRIGAQNFGTIAEIAQILHPRHGFRALALWSHKIIRWCVPFLLIANVTSLCFLAPAVKFYAYVLGALFIFVGVACLGYVFEKLKVRSGPLTLPYYFLAMNAALFVGFLKFAFRKQSPMWGAVRTR